MAALFAAPTSKSAAQETYRKPPQAVLDILDAPTLPSAWLDPTRSTFLVAQSVAYPPLSDLAAPMLRLAGLRIDPATHGQHRAPYWKSLTLKSLADGRERRLALPSAARVSFPQWTADGQRFAFTNTTRDGIELWIGDVTSASVRKVEGIRLSALFSAGFTWMSDQHTLLVRTVPPDRGTPPPSPEVPPGPNVQEGAGKSGVGSTYEVRDVLKSPYDEALFDHYLTATFGFVDAASGTLTSVGKPGVYGLVAPSSDGKYLLVERMHRPYSYLHPYSRFPREVEIWDRNGALVRQVASLPLADQVPIHGVPTGPRSYRWRPTSPATLVWVEALDGGDPMQKVPHRDRLMTWAAPFESEPVEIGRIEHRFAGLVWGEGGLALVSENDRERRWNRTWAIDVDAARFEPRLLWDLSENERYADPGSPVLRPLANGAWVMQQDGDRIYLSGIGASPDGDRPFLDRFNLTTRESERLFRCDRNSYESFIAWLDVPAGRFVTRRESQTDPPNYFVRTLRSGHSSRRGEPGEAVRTSAMRPLTSFRDPTPQLRAVHKDIVTYERNDGVPLSFTLYLPPGYKKGTRLPTVLWAYPLEYSDPGTAGQVSGSDRRFTMFGGASPLFLLLGGYAVLYNVAMPVVGHPDSVYNSFVDQISANVTAAIDKAVALGVTDPDRVGVMGHSHGALMTANLLAHTDVFRAGIARSGAYNHTMRPFGFQNERRTLYEARDVYVHLSPLMYADKINEPLLLIHGEIDANPGTVPLQSEMLYRAVVGTGGTARLVMLPLESHGYEARESVEHVLYEQQAWFDRWVKNAAPRTTASAGVAH